MNKKLIAIFSMALLGAGLSSSAWAEWGKGLRHEGKNPYVPCNTQSGWGCMDKEKPAMPKKTKKSKWAELKESLSSVKFEETKNGMKLTFASGILFATDSDQLNPAAGSEINKIAKWLEKNPKTSVRVEGHTDSTGEAEYNKDLSKRRAETVAQALENKGIEGRRVDFLGYGEENPIATNDTNDGRQANRRVEVFIEN